jgi:cytochrome oxidase Cu insertion factor (SCO1/SenC/PrrC family)
MIRRAMVAAALVGLVGAPGAGYSPAHAQSGPGIPRAMWEAAGIIPFPASVQAPTFSLSDLSGRKTDLRRFRGRVVMLYFWASW